MLDDIDIEVSGAWFCCRVSMQCQSTAWRLQRRSSRQLWW